jgi:hypothetical protein
LFVETGMDSIFVYSVASFLSAAFATTLTHPFDVVKTRVGSEVDV